jgi:hypothetical protein
MSSGVNSENAQMIVNVETQRLIDKKTQVEDLLKTQKRVIALNDSTRKRTVYLTRILYALLFALILILGILSINKYYFKIVILDLLVIVVIGIFAIYAIHTYRMANARDPTNFDQVYLPTTPKPSSNANAMASSIQQGDLLGAAGLNANACSGQACCGTDTHWNPVSMTCEKDTFTTIHESKYEKKDVNANSPFEYTSYVPYQ